MCFNMIVFDPTLDTFRFVHLSMREFLKKRAKYIQKTTNALTAERCLLNILNAVDNLTTRRFFFKHEQDSLNSAHLHNFKHYLTVN